jgi:hypothetical protein
MCNELMHCASPERLVHFIAATGIGKCDEECPGHLADCYKTALDTRHIEDIDGGPGANINLLTEVHKHQ